MGLTVVFLLAAFSYLTCTVLAAEDCISNFSCYPEGGNQLGHFEEVENATECRGHCQNNKECTFFTYYDENHATVLQNTCFTFTECEVKNRDCTGCFSGPQSCSVCATPSTNVGRWYCQSEESQENEKCFHTCGDLLQFSSSCQAGSFDIDETKIVCPCNSKPEGSDVHCDKSELPSEDGYPWGTRCTKTCSEKETQETVCDNGRWTKDLACSSSHSNSLYLVIGLSVVGGLVLISAGVVVYLLGFKTNIRPNKSKSQNRTRNFSTIDAYSEPNGIQSSRVPEYSQADVPDDRPQWNVDVDQRKPTSSNHYHFERHPQRTHQPRTYEEEERSHYPTRLYQQSRHLYQGRGARPGVTDQPLSRGTSLSEHQI